MTRADRRMLEDRLHLLADGDHRELQNEFAALAFKPEDFAQLWQEFGEGIRARWRELRHTPSAWWRALAAKAGVRV
jgi:hypothetical protein